MDAIVTVTAACDIGPGTVVIEFEAPDGFEVESGQSVKLSAKVDDEPHARFYMPSPPGVGDTFEVTIDIDPEEAGPFSQHLDSLAAGDDVETSGPFGQSYYDGKSRVVVFAGGPDVGPAVGIVEAAVADGNEAAAVYLDDAPAHEEWLSVLRGDGMSAVVIDGESDLADTVIDALAGDKGEQLFVYDLADFVSRVTDTVEAVGDGTDAAKVENLG